MTEQEWQAKVDALVRQLEELEARVALVEAEVLPREPGSDIFGVASS